MKSKTIKSVLRRKFDAWVESIEDEAVRHLVQRDGLITGGSIASLLMGEPVNDYDVYFTTQETTAAVARYYVEKFKQNPPSRFKQDGRVVPISVQEEPGRVKIVVKSQGIAGESGTEGYEYFEQVTDPTEPHEFVEQVAADLKDAKKDEKNKPKYRPVFLSSNAISLSDDIQIVIRFFGSADEIHENYDFVHCTCSWSAQTGELRLPPHA